MDVNDKIAPLIERTIREAFTDAAIESVRVVETLDFEDEAILEITVVFDEKDSLDPHKTVSIVRQIRDKLDESGDASHFPVLSFMSKTDAARLKPEAA